MSGEGRQERLDVDGGGESLDLSACDAQAGLARSHMLGLARRVFGDFDEKGGG